MLMREDWVMRFHGVVVITFALHAKGHGFETRWDLLFACVCISHSRHWGKQPRPFFPSGHSNQQRAGLAKKIAKQQQPRKSFSPTEFPASLKPSRTHKTNLNVRSFCTKRTVVRTPNASLPPRCHLRGRTSPPPPWLTSRASWRPRRAFSAT